jgi:hypothetical protein
MTKIYNILFTDGLTVEVSNVGSHKVSEGVLYLYGPSRTPALIPPNQLGCFVLVNIKFWTTEES